ncbi:MAG: PqqD family protein [Gammaproteobacteria bacterium]|nr:PqqD family protein [Gammaproteobacteria bacterium]MCY4228530.1 PqqD family protein [Gammaproteobacteria bacterium]
MSLSISAPLIRKESIVFTELDDQVVMLDTRSGKYLELDPVGSRIWAMLEDKPTIIELRDALIIEFDVDEETCLNDLSEFVAKLRDLELVSLDSDDAVDQ